MRLDGLRGTVRITAPARRNVSALSAGVGAGDEPDRVRMLRYRCLWWRAQLAVEHDRLRLEAWRQPNSQAWIVGQDRSHADQDGVVRRSQAVGEGQRFIAAERQPFSGGGSNAAVKTLGEGQGDPGPVGGEGWARDFLEQAIERGGHGRPDGR